VHFVGCTIGIHHSISLWPNDSTISVFFWKNEGGP